MVRAEPATADFHLRGNYAPVADEIEALDLEVEGSLPPELDGTMLRIGPNPKRGVSGHWFLGDGMLHGVRLRAGRALWYRNRWVRTRALETGDALVVDPATGMLDLGAGVANTNVVRHAGRLLALCEISFPVEVTAELATVVYDLDGRLTTAMTAHPKVCPLTGELHFWLSCCFRGSCRGAVGPSRRRNAPASENIHCGERGSGARTPASSRPDHPSVRASIHDVTASTNCSASSTARSAISPDASSSA